MDQGLQKYRNTRRDFQIWQRYTDGSTQAEIAQEFGLNQTRVSQILAAVRSDVPMEERRARQRRHLDELEVLREMAMEIAAADPIPAFSAGRPITMDDGSTAVDNSGKIKGAELLIKIQDRESKSLGLDAPTKMTIDTVAMTLEMNQIIDRLNSESQ